MSDVRSDDLISRLPSVRGKYIPNQSMAALTWFRVGGPADVLYLPQDVDDLSEFLKHVPRDVPLTVVGVGSNLLVRDGGVSGVVIRLGKAFATITAEEPSRIRAGAAALDLNVAKAAAVAGVAGLEFYSGIPGALGGALRMNAGSYGSETCDVLVECVALDRKGERHVIPAKAMGFSYRKSTVPSDLIFVEALFQGAPGNPDDIRVRMDKVTTSREATQPIKERTGGSTFKNPKGHKSWALIDAAGCRGKVLGDAQVSALHCNFLINRGNATGAELEALGEEVRTKVKAHSGIELQWEIKRIGRKASQ